MDITRLRRPLAALGLTLGFVVATTGSGFAANLSHDMVSATELAATSTVGTFSGIATGDLPGPFLATIVHEELGYGVADITGGSFKMLTSFGRVTGNFVGGTISPNTFGIACNNETFFVNGELGNVGISSDNGTGTFSGTLTHIRSNSSFFTPLLGPGCHTVAAFFHGTLNLDF